MLDGTHPQNDLQLHKVGIFDVALVRILYVGNGGRTEASIEQTRSYAVSLTPKYHIAFHISL